MCEIRNYMNYKAMTVSNKDYRIVGCDAVQSGVGMTSQKKEGKLASRITLLRSYIRATYWL